MHLDPSTRNVFSDLISIPNCQFRTLYIVRFPIKGWPSRATGPVFSPAPRLSQSSLPQPNRLSRFYISARVLPQSPSTVASSPTLTIQTSPSSCPGGGNFTRYGIVKMSLVSAVSHEYFHRLARCHPSLPRLSLPPRHSQLQLHAGSL